MNTRKCTKKMCIKLKNHIECWTLFVGSPVRCCFESDLMYFVFILFFFQLNSSYSMYIVVVVHFAFAI